MFLKKSVIILCLVFVFSDAAFVDTLNKCGKNDGECHKNLFQYVLKEGSKTGIPEVNIPPFDPVAIKDVHLPIQNVADLHLEDGVVKGLRKCIINDFSTSLEQGKASVDMTCDLTLKGRYKASGNSQLLQSLFASESIKGDGNIKVKLEKLNIKLDLHFFVHQHNGETYLKEASKPTYKFNVLGKVAFAVDRLYVGQEDASERITNLLNENWKLVVGFVGNQIMDRAIAIIRVYLVNFFETIPTKAYIIDDLQAYVK